MKRAVITAAAVFMLVLSVIVPAAALASTTSAPSVSTAPATGITSASATLNGSVNPDGLTTTWQFQYGTTTSGWSTGQNYSLTPASTLPNSSKSVKVSFTLTGLTAGTTYYYQIKASNSKGTHWAAIVSFTTTGTPPTYTVGGSASGLTGAAILEDNGGDDLNVPADGSFTFATGLTAGASYYVTVKTPPSGETCTVSGGSGTIGQANVTNVAVTCTAIPVYNKVVYLTFDDGPDPQTTPGVLSALEQNGAHATFCMVGSNGPVGIQPNPGQVDRIYLDGDALCDHTWDHPDMTTITTTAQQQAEVLQDRDAIYSAIGTSNVPLFFRYPYGKGTAFVDSSLAGWGLQAPAAYWSFDNQDWYPLCPGAAAIQANIEAKVFDGAVVLLHDVSYCGVAQMSYVGPVIQWLHANGYDVRALSPGVYPPQPAPLAAAVQAPAMRLE